eukprot:3346178-Heterocapsa_arctica.AAC.1
MTLRPIKGCQEWLEAGCASTCPSNDGNNVLEGIKAILEMAGLSSLYCGGRTRAYNLRHGEGHFKGLKIPFGSLIEFRPPKILLEESPKSGKTTMPGIMLGYHTNIGGTWLGEYYVSPLVDFQPENESGTLRMLRVATVV